MTLHDIPPNQVLTKAGFDFLDKMANLILKNINKMIHRISEVYITDNAELPADTLVEYLTLFVGYNLGTVYQADENMIHGMLDALHDQIPLAKKLTKVLEKTNQNVVSELKNLTHEEGIYIGQSAELLAYIMSVTNKHEKKLSPNPQTNPKELLERKAYELIEIYLNDTWQSLYQAYKNSPTGAYEILFAILSRVILLTCMVLAESMDFLDLYVKDVERYFLATSSDCAMQAEISIQ